MSPPRVVIVADQTLDGVVPRVELRQQVARSLQDARPELFLLAFAPFCNAH